MGWVQENIWDNIFKYAYPITFIGSIILLTLSILQKSINDSISNIYLLIIYYILMFSCSIISLLSWIDIDFSSSNNITSYIDLDLNQIISKIKYKNN